MNKKIREFDDYAEGEDSDLQVEEYDITASPNDFNVMTIFSFIESGAVEIPGFQRNYVWDIGRASKLIESLILGLPVPQVFLYEVDRNKFFVIDGQQRLMSIYYFIKKRFPRKDKRSELRIIFNEHGRIPEHIVDNDDYFENFRLKLPEMLPSHPNKFKGLGYNTLEKYKAQFELRTIRNVIIKQNSPKGDDSSMYEVFNRLNTGGINLRPQEIRLSMYHSAFYDVLHKVNADKRWRTLLGDDTPDLHMKDMEVLLRGFALLVAGHGYAPSMVKFLNQFSRSMRTNSLEQNQYYHGLISSFLDACSDLPAGTFTKNGRFNVALFEAVFVAACLTPLREGKFIDRRISPLQVQGLESDKEFLEALKEGTTQTKNVTMRLNRAILHLGPP